MNCAWVKENAALLLYEELPDDARHELEQHVAVCAACTKELEQLELLHRAFDHLPVEEPSPNLLAASRMKLQERLELTEQSRGFSRLALDLAGWMRTVRFQPALASALIMVGFTGGIMAGFVTSNKAQPKGGPEVSSASIASIQGITQDPGTNSVKITYDTLQPATVEGSLDNPEIQRLLLYAARNNNSGLRYDATSVLTQKPQDERIREALIFSLRYDKNPGVRLKALGALKDFVKQDVRVRDAVLEALLRDDNSGVRSEAIRSLSPVTADTSVRVTLEALAAHDKDSYIRNESRRVLATMPNVD